MLLPKRIPFLWPPKSWNGLSANSSGRRKEDRLIKKWPTCNNYLVRHGTKTKKNEFWSWRTSFSRFQERTLEMFLFCSSVGEEECLMVNQPVEEEQQVERVFFLTGRRTVPNSERVRKTILAKSRACLKGESVLENSSMGQKHIPAHLSKCRPEIRAPVCSRTKCQLQLGVFSMATSGKKRTWEKQLLCCPIED